MVVQPGGVARRHQSSQRPLSNPAPLASARQDREHVSRQNIGATLRLWIKTLEEKNRELMGLLEPTYAELALGREKSVSAGNAL